MEAQFMYWGNSESCGEEEGDIEPTHAGDIYDCYADGDIPCDCEADPLECNIAIKTTYGGLPGACDESEYEVQEIILDVCIPGDSESVVQSRIIECADGGNKIRNKVFESTDCTGDFEYNYDDIDDDTCYVIDCESFAVKLSLNTTYIIMMIFAAKLLL